MELTVVAFALGSAALHPLRDIFIKDNSHPEALCIAIFILWVPIAGLHVFLTGADLAQVSVVWPYVLASGVTIMLYHFFIVEVLRWGDVTVYYPIARSYPLLIVVVGVVVLGHRYSLGLLSGIALTLVGAFFLQFRRGAGLIGNRKALTGAFLAMACSATYSLTDAVAMRQVEPAAFFFWDTLVMIPTGMILFGLSRPRGRPLADHLFGGWRHTPARYVLAAITSYGSYLFILMAYQWGGNVAAVNAVRQASIPLSIVLGALMLSESQFKRRFLWALVLVAGIVAVILSR